MKSLLNYFAFTISLTLASTAISEPLDALIELINQEKMQDAYIMAKTMSQEQIGQADFDFLYGLASRGAGHAAEAVFALERAVMNNPSDMSTTYHYVLALVDVGDLQSAMENINAILAKEDLDATIRSNTEQLLGLINQASNTQESGFNVSSTINLDFGYNSNANSGTRGVPIFPIQGPISEEGYANLGATTLLKYRFSKIHSLYFSLASDNRKNFFSRNFDSNSLTGRLGYQITLENLSISVPIAADISFTDYAFDRYSASGGGEISYTWDSGNQTTFSAEFSAKMFPTNSLSNYFAIPISLSHWTNSILSGVAFSTSAFYTPGISFKNRTSNTIAHSEAGISLSASIQVAPGHFLTPSTSFLYLYYPVNSNATGKREDANFTGQLSYEWQITEQWTITPSFSYNRGWSTDPGQTYDRFQPQLGIRYQL